MPRLTPAARGLSTDARLDPYRNRVAVLARAGHLVGYLLVLTDRVTHHGGGRWRPRRQTPSAESATTHLRFQDGSGQVDDRIDGARLDAELEAWRRSELLLAGEVLSVRWLPPAESLSVAQHQFGVLGFDRQGGVIWRDDGENGDAPAPPQ